MGRIVFLLEEPSMKQVLDALLPRHFPDLSFLCVPHEGKNDLEKSIPRKLRGWREPGVFFVVVRDNDNEPCQVTKQRLANLCREAGRPDALVRLVCQELESWYIGDLEAVARAYDRPALAAQGAKARYRDPDSLPKPSEELERLVPEFEKLDGARRIGPLLEAERSCSHSLRVFLSGVRRVWEGMMQVEAVSPRP